MGEGDVRGMVRLVGEVAVLPGGYAEKKRFLMDGLAHLIGADAWVWGLSCQREPEKPQVYVSMLKNGFTEQSFVKLLQAVEHPEMVALTAPFFHELAQKQVHTTRLRYQITTERALAESQASLAWKAADIGPTILSLRPLDATSSSAVAFYRRHGREEFSPRDTRITHIVLSEVPWLHELGWPEDRGVDVPTLSRRQRLVLNLLILGQSQKEIATHMKISVHTVQGYIKGVYRHLRVKSQIELMSRFLQGDGRDVG